MFSLLKFVARFCNTRMANSSAFVKFLLLCLRNVGLCAVPGRCCTCWNIVSSSWQIFQNWDVCAALAMFQTLYKVTCHGFRRYTARCCSFCKVFFGDLGRLDHISLLSFIKSILWTKMLMILFVLCDYIFKLSANQLNDGEDDELPGPWGGKNVSDMPLDAAVCVWGVHFRWDSWRQNISSP